MLKHVFGGLLVAVLCIAPVFAEESDRADRDGPVPFADIGNVGDGDGDDSVLSEKGIEQDKQLLVSGEVRGDDLILRLPEGTKHDTLSLRSSAGLDIRNADLMRHGRIDGNDLIINLSDLRGHGDVDLGGLWVWGTGAESASLLQRVRMDGDTKVASVSTEVQGESEVRSDVSAQTDATLETDSSLRTEQRYDSTLGSSLRTDASKVEVERDVDGKVEVDTDEDGF